MDCFPDIRILNEILIFVDVLAVYSEVKIKRKSCVMLGVSRNSYLLSDIIFTILFGKFIDYLLLSGNASVCGIQL